jgi:hypothetical protein
LNSLKKKKKNSIKKIWDDQRKTRRIYSTKKIREIQSGLINWTCFKDELHKLFVHLHKDTSFEYEPNLWHWSLVEPLVKPFSLFIVRLSLFAEFNNFIKSSRHPRSSVTLFITKTKIILTKILSFY